MYTRIFDEIASGPIHARNIALECFRWMIYAKERPSLDTLRVTTALLERPNTVEDLEPRLLSAEYISEACRNLLQLPDPEHSQKSVAPIHFSFLEYLQDPPLDKLHSEVWKPLTDSRDAESILACRCMDWLSIALPEDFDSPRRWKPWSLSYAAVCFDKHAVCATRQSFRSYPSLLASTSRLLNAGPEKLASLVAERLFLTPIWREVLSRDYDAALSKSYLFWISDLDLIPELEIHRSQPEAPKHALYLAALYRPDKLESLLSNGHCPDEANADGRTPLWYACTHGCKTSVEILLRAGAMISLDTYGKSPLMVAVGLNDLEITKLLLQASSSSCALQEPDGEVALMKATSLEMVKLLSEAPDSDVNATDHFGKSVLGYFVSWVHPYTPVESVETIRIIDYLVSRGADLYTRSKAGMNVLDYAVCKYNNLEVVDHLLQLSPRPIEREIHGWTSLHWACKHGRLETARLLLENGLESKRVTTLQPPRSWTPYDIMVHRGFRFESPSDESTLYALGRPKKADLDITLPEDPIDYSQLVVEKVEEGIACDFCEYGVSVCHLWSTVGPTLLICQRQSCCSFVQPALPRLASCVTTLCTMEILIILSRSSTSA